MYIIRCNKLFFLHISGILAAPYNVSVAMSNTTFVFSWGAPYSLDVTDCSPDIFYYTLCTNITIYGCNNISSDPDCTFHRTCTTLLDCNDFLINSHRSGPIKFTIYAVNGAGNGNVTTASMLDIKEQRQVGIHGTESPHVSLTV